MTPEQRDPSAECWVDPIVEEIRQFREAYAARFNFDLHAMFEDMRDRTEEARAEGRIVIAAPERPTAADSVADPAA